MNGKLDYAARVLAVTASASLAMMGCASMDGILAMDDTVEPESPATYARVTGELREAQRLGLTEFGEGDPPVATAAQSRLIEQAGEHAASTLPVSARTR